MTLNTNKDISETIIFVSLEQYKDASRPVNDLVLDGMMDKISTSLYQKTYHAAPFTYWVYVNSTVHAPFMQKPYPFTCLPIFLVPQVNTNYKSKQMEISILNLLNKHSNNNVLSKTKYFIKDLNSNMY